MQAKYGRIINKIITVCESYVTFLCFQQQARDLCLNCSVPSLLCICAVSPLI